MFMVISSLIYIHAYKVLLGKSKGKKPLGKSGSRRKNIISDLK